ncbi:hypothetical protein A7X93_00470 [Stenotrophomonas maltophilia]|jgi:hypothetical protein|uniref:phage regulatory CII family protein n=1 Tax=Stenotrophomonas TaxID=40323 RepID=UPI000DA9233E|nr:MULTISPECIES: phage regulatory CII family protein [Stenotrophomonas]MDI9249054.1 hypothetical protein [Stenotrophomonas sp. RS-48]PZT35114.1 hypothetical protein A7X93_00470 [Stenotrophomonas maltophilia]UQY97348.1 hypothetical protein LZ605_08300 [Stenotrophomonas maltophilia]HEL5052592.1 hypothetical protein [Stenotrophomonas maltophilia]
MNITDAAHKTVKDSPGGAEALATRLITTNDKGEEKPMSGAVLRNKVNPNNTTHKLGWEEASEIMGLTGDHRMLFALAAEHGYGVHRLELPDEVGCLTSTILETAAVKGQFAELLHECLKDKLITENEFSGLQTAAAAVQSALIVLMSRLREAKGQGQVL